MYFSACIMMSLHISKGADSTVDGPLYAEVLVDGYMH